MKLLRTYERLLVQRSGVDIATRIKAGRLAKGLSQRELAKKLRVSGGAVGMWENGTNNPSLANRIDLAKVLDVPFIELMPEVASPGELVVREAEAIALLRRFQTLPQPVREAVLMQVVAVADSLGLEPPTEPPQTPEKSSE